jgi:histidinol-phosphate phosphatase family protein
MNSSPNSYALVIPSIGRPSLDRLLETVAALDTDERHPGPAEIVIVDDRRGDPPPLEPRAVGCPVRVVRGYGRGPAAARNRGWRAVPAEVEWVAFLDDDVELPARWARELTADLADCPATVAATQGRIVVPLAEDRAPTDWERNTAALEEADWATADMAYRRRALAEVHGFDERFPRAFREDADLALRVRQAGHRLAKGSRQVLHPVRPADDWVSQRVQAGNADDALMRRLHGPDWRRKAQAPGGGFGWHVATLVAAATTAAAALGVALSKGSGASPTPWHAVGSAGALGWAGLYARFVGLRMGPGPRPEQPGFGPELRRMVLTSATIPVTAVWHRARGWAHHRATGPWPVPVRAVLFDRDGTLVHDVPYNGDPERVRPVDGAVAALDRVRSAGLKTAVVSNQSGIGRGLLSADEVAAVNERIEALLGPFDDWQCCPHEPAAACDCRKPRPGMVLAAAQALGVRPEECVLIGDIGADVEAAQAAGARSIMVPTAVTRPAEVAAAPATAPDLTAAVDLVLSGNTAAGRRLDRPSTASGPAVRTPEHA